MRPIRIQRKRTKGWRMPENTVYVGRPSKWGNTFKVSDWQNAADAVRKYRQELLVAHAMNETMFRKNLIDVLKGKNLACWCPLDQVCHADVLLELANQ